MRRNVYHCPLPPAIALGMLIVLLASCSSPTVSYSPSGASGGSTASPPPATETIVFTVPLSAELQPATQLAVRYAAAPGKQHEIAVLPGDAVPLVMEKNKTAAVLVSEKASGTGAAGEAEWRNLAAFIYPYSLEPAEKNIFPALLLFELYASDETCRTSAEVLENIRAFNWPKLVESCETYEDAEHNLQKDPLKKAIKKGSFKKSDIKPIKKTTTTKKK